MVRVDLRSTEGQRLGERYDADVVPTFLVFDADAEITLRKEGSATTPAAEIRRALNTAG